MVTEMVEIKKKNTENLMILNNLRTIDFLTDMQGKVIIETVANLRKFLFA